MKTRLELISFAVNMYRQHLGTPDSPRILYAPRSIKSNLILSGGNFVITIHAVENLPFKLAYNSMGYLRRYYKGNAYPKSKIEEAFFELKSIMEELPLKVTPLIEVLKNEEKKETDSA
jgi:hypothetical protein